MTTRSAGGVAETFLRPLRTGKGCAMLSAMEAPQNQFFVGQVIQHKIFGYRGVIVGVDATFQLTPDWYEAVAKSRPPKDKPWYHVLVHGGRQTTYVAERNLTLDPSDKPVEHPLLDRFFDRFSDGFYSNTQDEN